MRESSPIVIVGGGHAAAQLCTGLAGAGDGARVHLVCEESELPYQRPPLSKAYLKNRQEALQLHHDASWHAQAGITVHRGDPATEIDRERRLVRLRSGAQLPYAQLVLATGARPRLLPPLGPQLANVAVLRSIADAQRLRELLGQPGHLTVLGAGFVGLEVAATARALGTAVTVIEAAPGLLTRSVSPEVGAHVLQTHRGAGIEFQLGAVPQGFDIEGGRLQALVLNGRRHPVDHLLLAVGAQPEVSLAASAGLHCDDGVVVDACTRTSDPSILAIGDCASFASARDGSRLRLESVQNANDQARTALATLSGRSEPYRALPWFWSEQAGLRLQMAGLMPLDGQRHRRPGATASSFSILHYVADQLRCVESVNAPQDHLWARKLLEAGRHPPPELGCDPTVALKSHL